MENAENVARLPLPSEIVISEIRGMTPNEMRRLKEASGKPLEDLLGDEGDMDEKVQMGIWLELTRRGFRPTWEEAGDVLPIMDDAPRLSDPTPTDTSPDSPGSVTSGG